jgi:hypothetical protein
MYTVQNTTKYDIKVASPITIMGNSASGTLAELRSNLYHVRFPGFIPAGKSVQVELDVPNVPDGSYIPASRGGFILYDLANRLQINLPEPDGPTQADH